MKTNMKKLYAILILAFVALFMFRFIMGFFINYRRSTITTEPWQPSVYSRVSKIDYEKSVSSNLQKIQLNNVGTALNQIEVFAKEAELSSATGEFEEDEPKTRSIVNSSGSLIRIERKQGLKPNRTLQLIIRVPESKFDGLVNDLRNLGKLESFQVTKEDKSEEAKNLLVEKKSLETYRASLVALRKAGGKVEELLSLEGKIHEVQGKIEDLYARIGHYTDSESYNNVSFVLGEQIGLFDNTKAYPLGARLMDSLIWTAKWYFLFLLLVTAVLGTIWSYRVLFQKSFSSDKS